MCTNVDVYLLVSEMLHSKVDEREFGVLGGLRMHGAQRRKLLLVVLVVGVDVLATAAARLHAHRRRGRQHGHAICVHTAAAAAVLHAMDAVAVVVLRMGGHVLWRLHR